jgi:hypothetical protein
MFPHASQDDEGLSSASVRMFTIFFHKHAQKESPQPHIPWVLEVLGQHRRSGKLASYPPHAEVRECVEPDIWTAINLHAMIDWLNLGLFKDTFNCLDYVTRILGYVRDELERVWKNSRPVLV